MAGARNLSLWLAIAVAGALLPTAVAAAQGQLCDSPQAAPFADRSSIAEQHRTNVDCLYELGVAQGTVGPDGQLYFRPAEPVTRGQFAGFLHRTLGEIDPVGELPEPQRPRFPDVASGHTFDTEIHVLAAAGVISGYANGLYGPNDVIRRDQAASLLLRAASWATGETLAAEGGPYFSDTEGNVHAGNIDAAFELDLVSGLQAPAGGQPGLYGPGGDTTRQQMGSVLVRAAEAIAELTDEPEPEPTPTPTPTPTPEPTLPPSGGGSPGSSLPTANQSFNVSPNNPAYVTMTGTPGAGVAAPRTYSVSSLNTAHTYNLALYPCGGPGEDATVRAVGNAASFRDQALNKEADNRGTTQTLAAEIASVAGVAQAPGTRFVSGINPASSNLAFGLDSESGDCAIPVIWRDTGATANQLDLDATTLNSWNKPVEPFGVGGRTVWTFGEASTGTSFNDTVLWVESAQRFWISEAGYRFVWGRDGDQYRYVGTTVNANMSETLWAAYLSVGDDVQSGSGPYNRTGANQFRLTSDTPGTPTNVTTAVGDFDGHADDPDVRVSWSPASPYGGNAVEYCVHRINTVTEVEGLVGCTVAVHTLSPDDAPRTLTDFDRDLTANTYRYRVEAESATGVVGDRSLFSAPVGLAADTTKPRIQDVRATLDDNLLGQVDDPDVHRFVFTEAMHADIESNGSTYVVRDSDGTIGNIVCGTNATCELSAVPDAFGTAGTVAGQVLQVTLTAPPTVTTAGSVGGHQYPLTITTVSAEWKDLAGNTLDLSGSPDRVIQA